MGQKIIRAFTPNRTSQTFSTTEFAIAGFISAIPQTFVAAPVERAKVLLQVQGQGGAEQKYKGVFDVVKVLYKEGGIRSIFRGTGATLARDGPGSAAYVWKLDNKLRIHIDTFNTQVLRRLRINEKGAHARRILI